MSFSQAHGDHLDPDLQDTGDGEEPTEASGQVHSLKDLLRLRGLGEDTEQAIRRNTYKFTDCGADFGCIAGGVFISSIVEGVDDLNIYRELLYPFDIKEFWSMLQAVSEEADETWNDTHGCPNCGAGEGTLGYPVVNPACIVCLGAGIVI